MGKYWGIANRKYKCLKLQYFVILLAHLTISILFYFSFSLNYNLFSIGTEFLGMSESTCKFISYYPLYFYDKHAVSYHMILHKIHIGGYLFFHFQA